RVSFTTHFQGAFHEEVIEVLRRQGAGDRLLLSMQGCDETSDYNLAVLHTKSCKLCGSAKVFIAIRLGKSKIFVESVPKVVAVQPQSLVTVVEESSLQGPGHGRFPRPR